MKAVVMETENKVAVVLTENGTFEKINRSCLVGDTLEVGPDDFVTDNTDHRTGRWIPYVIAAVLLIGLISAGVYSRVFKTYTYVTYDAKLSYELNQNNEVIRVYAVSEESVSIVESLNNEGVRGSSISEALVRTDELLTDDSTGDAAVVTVTTDDEERERKVVREIETADINVYVVTGNDDITEEESEDDTTETDSSDVDEAAVSPVNSTQDHREESGIPEPGDSSEVQDIGGVQDSPKSTQDTKQEIESKELTDLPGDNSQADDVTSEVGSESGVSQDAVSPNGGVPQDTVGPKGGVSQDDEGTVQQTEETDLDRDAGFTEDTEDMEATPEDIMHGEDIDRATETDGLMTEEPEECHEELLRGDTVPVATATDAN